MEFPQDLKKEIEQMAKADFESPTQVLGDNIALRMFEETQQILDDETKNIANYWEDYIHDLIGWREFVIWLWSLIKKWWDSTLGRLNK